MSGAKEVVPADIEKRSDSVRIYTFPTFYDTYAFTLGGAPFCALCRIEYIGMSNTTQAILGRVRSAAAAALVLDVDAAAPFEHRNASG